MPDRYQRVARSRLGRLLVPRLGLPDPEPLRRHRPGAPLVDGTVLLGSGPAGRMGAQVERTVRAAGAAIRVRDDRPDGADPAERLAALVFDATGVADSSALGSAYEFFHPAVPRLAPCGRVLVIGVPPDQASDVRAATAQRALEGFVRSLARELRQGGTAQLVQVAPGAEGATESTLRFLLSARSAYVSGQVVRVAAGRVDTPDDWDRPLAGKVALVTGAARGIGAAIATTLARDGAFVVCADVPAQGDLLSAVANDLRGCALQLDVTADGAPARLADHLRARHGGLDVVVHNAGITRDRTLGRMSRQEWDSVLGVNLAAQERIDEVLLGDGVLREGGRIVGVASISGIAGNRGQTNYAASKAGVIGRVQALAPVLAGRDITVNAVAPGFIETRLTAAMPAALREAGRRMNSLAQGGRPVDVAETVAWLAGPASGGVTGNVVRVCGQSLLGA